MFKASVAKEMTKQINACNSKREEVNDKIVDAKNEYQNKEAEYKQRKSKIKELKANIDALRSEYEDSKEDLANIKVIRMKTKNNFEVAKYLFIFSSNVFRSKKLI